MKHAILMSQGQLFKTQSPNKVIESLSNQTGINRFLIKAVFAWDMLRDYLPFNSGSLINRYKKGEIEWGDFCNGVRSYLWQNETALSNDSIKESWNAMLGAYDEKADLVYDLLDSETYKPNTIFIIPGSTNKVHWTENLKNKFEGFDFKENVIFVHSFEERTLNLNELVKKAELPEGTKLASVTSLHKGINPKLIGEAGKTQYFKIPTNAKSDLATLIKEHHDKELLQIKLS